MKMKAIEAPFFYGASPEIHKRAKELRRNLTDTEVLLWERLRKAQIAGYNFRRQHPIRKFIVDFYCHKALLVIELDGGIHDKLEVAERDDGREYELKKLGLRVIRFKNEEVLNNINWVLKTIESAVKE